MTMVRICSDVDKQDKLLVAQLDLMWKHAGRQRVEKDIYDGRKLKVKHGELYFLKDTTHVWNEATYFGKNLREGHGI